MASSARPGAVGKGPIEVIVRSAEDPFVFAMNLTDGTLSFGPSSDGARRACLCAGPSVLRSVLRFAVVLCCAVPVEADDHYDQGHGSDDGDDYGDAGSEDEEDGDEEEEDDEEEESISEILIFFPPSPPPPPHSCPLLPPLGHHCCDS